MKSQFKICPHCDLEYKVQYIKLSEPLLIPEVLCPFCSSVLFESQVHEFVYFTSKNEVLESESSEISEPTKKNRAQIMNERRQKYKCQKCGKSLMVRTNSIDNTSFYGCSGFPRCKYTIGILELDGLGIPDK